MYEYHTMHSKSRRANQSHRVKASMNIKQGVGILRLPDIKAISLALNTVLTTNVQLKIVKIASNAKSTDRSLVAPHCRLMVWSWCGYSGFFSSSFFFYEIHISPDTGVNNGVWWWWGPLSSADQRSRLHSSWSVVGIGG